MLNLPRWNITEMNGYVPVTTFWDDFSIAERFGSDAIQDTFNRAFNEWKGEYKYLTELVMVLNHKIWQYYESNNEYTELYSELWKKADAYACENLKGVEAHYFFETTD